MSVFVVLSKTEKFISVLLLSLSASHNIDNINNSAGIIRQIITEAELYDIPYFEKCCKNLTEYLNIPLYPIKSFMQEYINK